MGRRAHKQSLRKGMSFQSSLANHAAQVSCTWRLTHVCHLSLTFLGLKDCIPPLLNLI